MNVMGLVALLIAAHPAVTSSLDCPAARDIASQLSVIMPATAEAGSVVVSAVGDDLLVDLRPDNAAFAALRTVTVGSDCQERARATAIVISTWWPQTGMSRPPTAPPMVVESPVGMPRPRRFTLGAAAFASIVATSAAAGGRLEARWLPARRRGFGLRAAAAYTGALASAVGNGQASWSRASLELGPSYALGPVALDAGAVLSRLWLRGDGYAEDQTSQGNAFGMTMGGRIERAWGRLVPWLEARGLWWPQAQQIYVLDLATAQRTSRDLPHVELQLGAGIAIAF